MPRSSSWISARRARSSSRVFMVVTDPFRSEVEQADGPLSCVAGHARRGARLGGVARVFAARLAVVRSLFRGLGVDVLALLLAERRLLAVAGSLLLVAGLRLRVVL